MGKLQSYPKLGFMTRLTLSEANNYIQAPGNWMGIHLQRGRDDAPLNAGKSDDDVDVDATRATARRVDVKAFGTS